MTHSPMIKTAVSDFANGWPHHFDGNIEKRMDLP